MRTEKQKMLAGEPYHASDPELQADLAAAAAWTVRYNAALAEPASVWHALLAERLALIRPPFHCDYGYNISVGAGVFLNFGCVILDVAPVSIGADTRIGPAVQIYTADHPRDADERRTGIESGCAVTIGTNVWIGGGAIILPGVRIGDNAIVGAGSVVTHDVPDRATVAGNPARILTPRRSRAGGNL
jgi:maltose O-acetyltransferase